MAKINRHYVLERKKRGISEANEAPIADVLHQFLQKNHIDYNPYETKVKGLFYQITGDYIAQFVTNVHIFKNILYVRVCSPAVKVELLMVSDALKNQINNQVGHKAINKIIVK